MNKQHPNIDFTFEHEQNNTFALLDVIFFVKITNSLLQFSENIH